MTQETLKPCPFCGGYARPMRCQIGIEGTMGCNKWVTITCSMCEINNGWKGGFMRPRYDTEEEAAKAWNTRAQPQNVEGDLEKAHKRILDLEGQKWFLKKEIEWLSRPKQEPSGDVKAVLDFLNAHIERMEDAEKEGMGKDMRLDIFRTIRALTAQQPDKQ